MCIRDRLYTPVRQGIARFQKLLSQSGESAQMRALPPQLPQRPEAVAYLDREMCIRDRATLWLGRRDVTTHS